MKKHNKNKEDKNLVRDIQGAYTVGSDVNMSHNWEVYRNVKSGDAELSMLVNQAKEVGITKNLYSELLEINLRTLNRYISGASKLDSDKKEKAYRLKTLFEYGVEVFGSNEIFSKWLFEHNTYLNDKPVNFISIISGIEIVSNLLGKIEYGVY